MAARVALTVVSAVAFTCVGAVAYVAAWNGALDAFLADPEGRSTAPQMVSQPSPREPRSATQATARPPMPNVPTIVVLIRNAIVALHQANIAGNYSVLREIAAPGFQQTNSPASLSEAFTDLRSRGLDLGQITVVNPRLYSDPTINEQGVLRLVGFYPAGSTQVEFELHFQTVGGRWRLFGIGLHPSTTTDPVDGGNAPKSPEPMATAKPQVPDTATMVALIRSTVIALNQANMAGDYSVLRDISAPGFQRANSLAQIGAIFTELRSRQLDLGPVAVVGPKLFRPPGIDQQGYLRLAGYFPSRPEQVNFDLAFQFSDAKWLLFGIGLNTSREVPAAPAPVSSNLKPSGSTGTPSLNAPPIPRERPSQ